MTAVEWKCPACRARGSVDVRAGTTDAEARELVIADHAVAQPRCLGRARPVDEPTGPTPTRK